MTILNALRGTGILYAGRWLAYRRLPIWLDSNGIYRPKVDRSHARRADMTHILIIRYRTGLPL